MAAVVLFSLLILGLARGARVRLAWVAGRARGKRCSNAGNRKRKRGRSGQKPPSRRWLENLRLIVNQLGESGRLGVGHLASCFFRPQRPQAACETLQKYSSAYYARACGLPFFTMSLAEEIKCR